LSNTEPLLNDELAGSSTDRPLNTFAQLAAMAQEGVGEDDGHHGFTDRDAANTHARIMTALGANFDLSTCAVN
jgi:hypothetical protein